MNECLKLPKALTMSFGNDLEKIRDGMECAELISNYVAVLHNILKNKERYRRLNCENEELQNVSKSDF